MKSSSGYPSSKIHTSSVVQPDAEEYQYFCPEVTVNGIESNWIGWTIKFPLMVHCQHGLLVVFELTEY
jgi:hypothetical protein